MPRKIDFTIISNSPTIHSFVTQKKTALTPKKKLKSKHAVGWLDDIINTASSETSLWVAVISQAMVDALSKSKKSEAIYQKHEAINWLTGNSKDFVDVCIAANLNPDYVRRKAKHAISNPSPWRAEAGKGKRYEERKEYRKRKRLKEKLESQKITTETNVFSLF